MGVFVSMAGAGVDPTEGERICLPVEEQRGALVAVVVVVVRLIETVVVKTTIVSFLYISSRSGWHLSLCLFLVLVPVPVPVRPVVRVFFHVFPRVGPCLAVLYRSHAAPILSAIAISLSSGSNMVILCLFVLSTRLHGHQRRVRSRQWCHLVESSLSVAQHMIMKAIRVSHQSTYPLQSSWWG